MKTSTKGLFVVIIGPDGSGKTTVADAIEKECLATYGMMATRIHGGFNILPHLKILRKAFAALLRKEMRPDPDYTIKHSGAIAKPHNLSRSFVYLIYYYWDYLLGHCFVKKQKQLGRLILADRYFYDYFYQRGNMNLPHGLLRVLCNFIPRPDVLIFLNADAQAIYDRKNELTTDEIERQQKIITKILAWLPNSITVESDQHLSATMSKISEMITRKLKKI